MPQHIDAYFNADELEAELKLSAQLNLNTYHPALFAAPLIEFLKEKQRPSSTGLIAVLPHEPILLSAQCIQFQPEAIDSYLCARIIDYIRLEFLCLKISFTFETVMSHISKVEFLQLAKQQGYRTYLYFVSTVDPDINIARVQYRVSQGGHGVPEHKIRERYYRSMDLLMQAVDATDRTYFFDNSSNGENAAFIAEIEQAETLKLNPVLEELPK